MHLQKAKLKVNPLEQFSGWQEVTGLEVVEEPELTVGIVKETVIPALLVVSTVVVELIVVVGVVVVLMAVMV